MQIAAVLFPRLTALDMVGPYEVLQRLPGATVTFVGHERGEVRTENGFLGLTVDATFDEVMSPDVVIMPGGTRRPGWRARNFPMRWNSVRSSRGERVLRIGNSGRAKVGAETPCAEMNSSKAGSRYWMTLST